MKTILHPAESRGHADHGWLTSRHTFSFSGYFDPERVQFGKLRVLNDDQVAGGKGFGTHPHQNMEIISIPLEGDLEHKDSMGNTTVIRQGDIQVMSAGTGVSHSEYNKNEEKPVKFLQIWVLPNKKDVSPRYDQITLNNKNLHNQLSQILSPNSEDEAVWIYQNAWFHLGNLEQGIEVNYSLKAPQTNGLYVFVLEGEVSIENLDLQKRDGLGIWEVDQVLIKAKSPAQILLMEVPMDTA